MVCVSVQPEFLLLPSKRMEPLQRRRVKKREKKKVDQLAAFLVPPKNWTSPPKSKNNTKKDRQNRDMARKILPARNH